MVPMVAPALSARSYHTGICDSTDIATDTTMRHKDNHRGCTGEFSTKKMFSKLFFSQCNVVGMVCMMNTHQKNF
jgi:hypothetical protein